MFFISRKERKHERRLVVRKLASSPLCAPVRIDMAKEGQAAASRGSRHCLISCSCFSPSNDAGFHATRPRCAEIQLIEATKEALPRKHGPRCDAPDVRCAEMCRHRISVFVRSSFGSLTSNIAFVAQTADRMTHFENICLERQQLCCEKQSKHYHPVHSHSSVHSALYERSKTNSSLFLSLYMQHNN
jgi:hypothetical protein